MSAETYYPTIGLEIHAELKTSSKMFCGCVNDPDCSVPNTNICPVCMAHPGTLPVINREAVRHVLRVGSAVGGKIADFTEFDRKNYFYPDIPKNYQISQYKYPLISGGAIGSVNITRIHLEEDTARSAHSDDGSNVDFNRAGVPLMELVTEPVIHDATTAVSFARELRILLVYLGASGANLEKGEMRIEANVSIAPTENPGKLGTKVEVKNLNSFKAVESAIAFEIDRQARLLDAGEKVAQETRGWDESKQRTFSQRAKEESHDYRYFPDPDLPKLCLSEIAEFNNKVIADGLPELPAAVRERYVQEGVAAQVAATLVMNVSLKNFYEKTCTLLTSTAERVAAANLLVNDVQGLQAKGTTKRCEELQHTEFASLVKLALSGDMSSRGTKDTLAIWLRDGGEPRDIAQTQGLLQRSSDDYLSNVLKQVINDHEHVVNEYRNGKDAALQYLVGQAMKQSKGAANPTRLQELLRELLQP